MLHGSAGRRPSGPGTRNPRLNVLIVGGHGCSSPALASFAILEMCLSIARGFRDDGARTAEQVADEYADFALRIAGFVPDRPSPGVGAAGA